MSEALLSQLDAKNVLIGRMQDQIMRLTKAVASRDQDIKELKSDLKSCMARELAALNDLPIPQVTKP